MDGARLWEAQAYYCNEHVSLHTFCQLFDTINVSFYKGIGAITGAMLLSNISSFADDARIWLRRFGGNLYSLLPYGVNCWYHFKKNSSINTFVERKLRLQTVISAIQSNLMGIFNKDGSNISEDKLLVQFDPPIPECSLIHVYFHTTVDICNTAHMNIQTQHNVSVYNKIRGGTLDREDYCYFEFNMGYGNMMLPNQVWVDAYTALALEIQRLHGEVCNNT